MPGLLPANEGLRFDLPPGRPAIYRTPPQRMLEVIPGDGPDGLMRAARLLLATVRGFQVAVGGPADEYLRRRWVPSRGRREILGLPLPQGSVPASGAAEVSTWEYGIVGTIRPAGGSPEEKRKAFALLQRHVQEQGYGMQPEGREEVCLGDPLRESLEDLEALLVCRLARFY